MDYAALAQKNEKYIVDLRRHFHRNPELSLEEFRTTEDIARVLAELGIPVTRYQDHTGLVATITGSKSGGRVLLRADIDALPIPENTGLPFAAENGNMHACGHDCHISMLLGAAKLLQETREELCGTVRLLFQSAEEISLGASHAISEGCLDGVGAVFGMHIWSTLDAPLISIESGPRMAACENFDIIIHGKAAHGASPHLGCDAVVAAAAGITQLQGYVARRNNAANPLIVTIGTVNGGERRNIVADTVTLSGTARCFNNDQLARLPDEILGIFSAATTPYGCTAEWRHLPSCERAVINEDESLVELGRSCVRKLYGEEVLGKFPPLMASEDFARFGEFVPSLFAFVGGGNKETGAIHPHHNEKFCIDESVLPRGAALYAQFAADFLNQNGGIEP